MGTLNKATEFRRKLQTFQIGADSLSSVILLSNVVGGNEFKTSDSSVITSVIDEMKRTLDGKVKEVDEQIMLMKICSGATFLWSWREKMQFYY